MQWPDTVLEYLHILQVLVPTRCFCQNQVLVKCVPTQCLRPSYDPECGEKKPKNHNFLAILASLMTKKNVIKIKFSGKLFLASAFILVSH